MKQAIVKITVIIPVIIFITSSHLFADTSNPGILKSYVSEDASYNGFALSMADCVTPKNKKDCFVLEDKKITWSAAIKGGVGSHDNSNYLVCWYAPDGVLFEKQTPKSLFIDCAGLKSSLNIEKEKFNLKTGLWKIEVVYKNDIIDNKYFYILGMGAKEITQEDIKFLETLISKNRPVVEVVAAEAVKPPENIPKEIKGRLAQHMAEKEPKDLTASYETISAEETNDGEKLSFPKSKNLSEHLTKIEKQVVDESSKVENLLTKRGNFYEDEKLLTYLNDIEKRIASGIDDADLNIKIKIIRDPAVNAFALANGSIYITTGALSRLDNEAQLAFILAHETSHIANKDMVYHTNSSQNKTVVYKLFDIVLAPTSVFFGLLGDLTQMGFGLLYASSITGYGRNIEARADMDSVPLGVLQGYKLQESVGMIEILLKEHEKYQKGIEVFFLMDHPTNEWRIKKLKELIDKKYKDEKTGMMRSEEFLNTIADVKIYNTRLNIKLDRLEHAKDNIQWVLEKFPANPEAHYLNGEIYRLESEDKKKVKDELVEKRWNELNKGYKKEELEDAWRKKALEEYDKAIGCDPSYANSYKGLGLLYSYKNDKEKALQNFQQYLELAPNAEDKRYVTSLMARLNKPPEEKKK